MYDSSINTSLGLLLISAESFQHDTNVSIPDVSEIPSTKE